MKERVFYAMGIENGEIDPYGGLAYKPIQKLLWILRMNFKGADLSGQPKSEDAAGAAVC